MDGPGHLGSPWGAHSHPWWECLGCTSAAPHRPFPAVGQGKDKARPASLAAPLMGVHWRSSPQTLARVGVSHRQGVPPPRRAEMLLHRHFRGLPWDPCLTNPLPLSIAERVPGLYVAHHGCCSARPQNKVLAAYGWSRPLLQTSHVRSAGMRSTGKSHQRLAGVRHF